MSAVKRKKLDNEVETESENEEETISHQFHANELATGVTKLFDVKNNNNKFSDIEVKVGTETFYCHKLILQINSNYFAKLNFKSKTQTLKNIDPDAFYEALKFMYKGKVLMSTNNVESLYTAADILGIDGMKQECLQFTSNLIRSDRRNARLYPQLNLIVSEDMMKVILSDDNLDVKSEVEVCEMLMKWLQVHTEARYEVHPAQLLPLIRWSAISVDYFESELHQNTTLTSDPEIFSFVTKLKRYLHSGIQFEGLQTFHRPSTGLENCLMILGLSDGQTTSSEVHSISLQQPEKVTTLIAIPSKVNYWPAACLVNSNVYVTGAGDLSNETWTWSLVSGWSKCANMLTGRRYHCSAIVGSMLYVLGGKVDTDKITLSSVECYNTKTIKWFSAGQLIHAIWAAACVTYKNSIYVCGGRDKYNTPVPHIQVYNPAQESCTLMDTPMLCAYIQMRAVLWETSVILLDRNTCFIYNFETQTWQERKQFNTGVYYFASSIDNSRVYIAGGGTSTTGKDNKEIWTCTDEIKSVSVLDIIENKPADWRQEAKLLKPCMIAAYISIALP